MGLFSRKTKGDPRPVEVVRNAADAGPSPSGGAGSTREARVFEFGSEMLTRARRHKTSVLSAKFYSDALMNWSMKDHEFKVQMFRFVDAFPALKTPEAIFDHLKDYLSQPGVTVPGPIELALKAGSVLKGAAAGQIAKQITGMASKFIAGVDAASALPGLRSLWNDDIAFSVDLLGEACLSDEEANHYRDKYLDLVANLPATVASWPAKARLEADHLGPVPRTNVSVKVSSLSAKLDAIDTEGSIRELMTRLLPILEAARDRGVFVNFDMEHHALKDLTLELFQRCCEKIDFHAGLAMQAYLRSGVEDARRIVEWSRRSKRLVTVRLVKGAYWDAETIKAEQHGWPCPVWAQKWQTDQCFERMTELFLDATPKTKADTAQGGIKLALGSHNVRSIAAALAGLEQRGLGRDSIELQMLHGMADQLKYAAAEMGLRVREYVPVGEMIPGMAYLVRRLLENTSNESWLKAGFMENADPGVLLRAPAPAPGQSPAVDLLAIAPERHGLSPAPANVGTGRAFVNEAMRDFSERRQRDAFAASITRATVPRPPTDRTPDEAVAMIARAHEAFPAWRETDPRVRADVLVRAAALMRAQRDGLAGVMIREAGKTWREADGDVCEAIDFCEYYARCAVPLFARARLGKFIGELDETLYEPRGVAAVISPWNFPLAILCGMAAAALVTGNPTIIKPSEQTRGIASILAEIMWEALDQAGAGKLGREVFHFCPGPGRSTGAALVNDPRVALIAFTGSMEVGLNILRVAGDTKPGMRFVKKVVCEMGGKNAIIVDTSADLDEAVLGVRSSAFGYQGQKCSACSRVIVVDAEGPEGPAIRAFTRRLVESTKALVIGDPLLPGTDLGPVIDAGAKTNILRYIEIARKEARLELAMEPPPGLEKQTGRDYVGPHIFSNVSPRQTIACEEIFGPVLAVMHAPSFSEAIRIGMDPPFRLTGAVFTRKPSHIEQAKREFRVGNLYINRGSTGALVARQPFGGGGMSGVGTKAGGIDYLLHFTEPRAICENTLRRGFAPEL